MAAETSARDTRWVMVAIAATVVVFDRVTKLWVEKHVSIGQAIVVWPHVFRITHVLNTGAAFSMFEQARSPELVRNVLVAFSIVTALAVVAMLWRMGRAITSVGVALALILGGALGNLYDRVRYAHVIDFLEVHIVHYHWPDFNVADSCIVIGACLLLLDMLRPRAAGTQPVQRRIGI